MTVKLHPKPPQKKAVSLEHLPAPPAAMRAILQAASDPATPLHELARLVCYEPSFTVEILRVVNSAFYSRRDPICSGRRATVVLGSRAVRNHAVAHVLRVAAQNLYLGEFDLNKFWEDAVRRSTIALILGELAGCEDPQEAATIGLIQEGGVLLIAATWPEYSRQIQHNCTKPAPVRLPLETQLCGVNHAQIFGDVAGRWGMPADIVDAIRGHHDPRARGGTRRANRLLEIARVADAVSDVFGSPRNTEVLNTAAVALETLPRRRNVTLSSLINQVEARTPSIARELRIGYPDRAPITELVVEAVASMVQITHQYETVTQDLEGLLVERQQANGRLEHSNSQLALLATTDGLTGIANRRYFTEVLKHTVDEGVRSKTPTSVIVFDLDHFKDVNDTHGHAAGDDVLRRVAERVGRALRPSDMIGRIGGEEFAIVLPNTDEKAGRLVAERVRRAICNGPIRARGRILIPITASLGGVTVRKRASTEDILRHADDAMYASKNGGRDSTTWAKR